MINMFLNNCKNIGKDHNFVSSFVLGSRQKYRFASDYTFSGDADVGSSGGID